MDLKNTVLSLLNDSRIGCLAGLLGQFTRHRRKLGGLTNPFHVSSYVVDRDGSRYIAPVDSYLTLQSPKKQIVTFDGRHYEPEISYLTQALIRPGDTVLDIGANVGLHTVAFARLASSGTVLAFEPVPHLAERLSLNCALNGLHNVTLVRCGLGNENGQLEMFVNIAGEGMEGTSSFLGTTHMESRPDHYRKDTLPVRRLDDIIGNLGIQSRISFIKMDTEGFEPLIIEGALSTINAHRPAMLIEAHSSRLAKLGKNFGWYRQTFPDYHILMVPETTAANPYFQLVPLENEPDECCVNLLFLPRTERCDVI